MLKLWQDTLDCLESDPTKLSGALDWVTKKLLLSKVEDQAIEVRKKLDLPWESLPKAAPPLPELKR